MADHANRYGATWVSAATLAKETGLSAATVKNIRRDLAAGGTLFRVGWVNRWGGDVEPGYFLVREGVELAPVEIAFARRPGRPKPVAVNEMNAPEATTGTHQEADDGASGTAEEAPEQGGAKPSGEAEACAPPSQMRKGGSTAGGREGVTASVSPFKEEVPSKKNPVEEEVVSSRSDSYVSRGAADGGYAAAETESAHEEDDDAGRERDRRVVIAPGIDPSTREPEPADEPPAPKVPVAAFSAVLCAVPSKLTELVEAQLGLDETLPPYVEAELAKTLAVRSVPDVIEQMHARWPHYDEQLARGKRIRNPVGVLCALLALDWCNPDPCPDVMCERGVRMDTGRPCARCEERRRMRFEAPEGAAADADAAECNTPVADETRPAVTRPPIPKPYASKPDGLESGPKLDMAACIAKMRQDLGAKSDEWHDGVRPGGRRAAPIERTPRPAHHNPEPDPLGAPNGQP